MFTVDATQAAKTMRIVNLRIGKTILYLEMILNGTKGEAYIRARETERQTEKEEESDIKCQH